MIRKIICYLIISFCFFSNVVAQENDTSETTEFPSLEPRKALWGTDYSRNVCTAKLYGLVVEYDDNPHSLVEAIEVNLLFGKFRRFAINHYAWHFGFDYDDLMIQIYTRSFQEEKNTLSDFVLSVDKQAFPMELYDFEQNSPYRSVYFLYGKNAEAVWNAFEKERPVYFQLTKYGKEKVSVEVKAERFSIASKMFEACLGV